MGLGGLTKVIKVQWKKNFCNIGNCRRYQLYMYDPNARIQKCLNTQSRCLVFLLSSQVTIDKF